jgi:hypothetical protein
LSGTTALPPSHDKTHQLTSPREHLFPRLACSGVRVSLGVWRSKATCGSRQANAPAVVATEGVRVPKGRALAPEKRLRAVSRYINSDPLCPVPPASLSQAGGNSRPHPTLGPSLATRSNGYLVVWPRHVERAAASKQERAAPPGGQADTARTVDRLPDEAPRPQQLLHRVRPVACA